MEALVDGAKNFAKAQSKTALDIDDIRSVLKSHFTGLNDERVQESMDSPISEGVKYHLERNLGLLESVYRPGSKAWFNLVNEFRRFNNAGKIQISDNDKWLLSTDVGKNALYEGVEVPLDFPMAERLDEAEYKGKEVELNVPRRGGSKKYYVYVKNPDTGNVKKIQFGDVTGLTAKVSDPEARKNFAARHQCSTKTDKTTAGYWACRINKYGHLWGGKTYPGYW